MLIVRNTGAVFTLLIKREILIFYSYNTRTSQMFPLISSQNLVVVALDSRLWTGWNMGCASGCVPSFFQIGFPLVPEREEQTRTYDTHPWQYGILRIRSIYNTW